MSTVPRSALLRPDPTPADCRHVREPFDQSFHVVGHRSDIGSDAKVVHAHLVSLRRLGHAATQREMADTLGLTRHRVWSALQQLVGAGLLRAIRYGLGRPNGYELLGLDAADLDGRSRPETGARTLRTQHSGRSGDPARARPTTPRNEPKKPEYRAPGIDPAIYTSGPLSRYIRT